MNRIILVEDHERMAGLICKALSGAGIEADVYATLAHAEQGMRQVAYAALVLDRGLPDGDGLALLRRLRQHGIQVPCLMLTARDALHDRIDGLDAGADDYLAKPFEMDEMVARVRALMRRAPHVRTATPRFGALEMMPADGLMRAGVASAALPPAELQVMLSLVEADGATVRRKTLDLAAWGLGVAVTPNALDVALHRLRRKLLAIRAGVRIVNVRGLGYTLKADDDGQS